MKTTLRATPKYSVKKNGKMTLTSGQKFNTVVHIASGDCHKKAMKQGRSLITSQKIDKTNCFFCNPYIRENKGQ